MADDQNQTSGGTIDLRNLGGSQAQTGGAAAVQNVTQDQLNKFEIPETVKNQYPDLIPLIIKTESMNDDERQYWFQIIPIMNEEQIVKLREILQNEKKQLETLDNEYQQELGRINTKHASQWKAFEAKEKREKIQAAEGAAQQSEKAKEEELLKKLQDL